MEREIAFDYEITAHHLHRKTRENVRLRGRQEDGVSQRKEDAKCSQLGAGYVLRTKKITFRASHFCAKAGRVTESPETAKRDRMRSRGRRDGPEWNIALKPTASLSRKSHLLRYTLSLPKAQLKRSGISLPPAAPPQPVGRQLEGALLLGDKSHTAAKCQRETGALLRAAFLSSLQNSSQRFSSLCFAFFPSTHLLCPSHTCFVHHGHLHYQLFSDISLFHSDGLLSAH